jgi:glycosyltransferase involved in cell wall biosynthesis
MTTVVYDHQIFSSQSYGGISRYFCEVAKLIGESDDLTLKILAGIYINEYLSLVSSKKILGYKRPLISLKTINSFFALNDRFTKIYANSFSPDIIHQTYYFSEYIAPRKTKIVITVYDMIHEKFKPMFSELDDFTSKKKMEAVDRADQIICISENTKNDLIEIFNIDPRKIEIIHLASSMNSDIDTSSINFDFSFPYILYVGARDGYKNFQTLLRAFANCENLKHDFYLICFGGSSFTIDELKLIYELGLNSVQIIHTSGSDQALAFLYKHSSAFVYPSLYEGFGIPPLEAMSLGCPVVCSNTSSIPEVVGGAAEFFDPNYPDSISVALKNVLYSSDKTNLLINMGFERAKSFTWEKCAAKTSAIYQSLI